MNDREDEEIVDRMRRGLPFRFNDFKQLVQKKDDAIETKEFIVFKLRWGELAKEAMKILNKIKELEGESVKLMERERAGEFIKDLLKQNEIDLKQLKKREMKIYLESEKILRNAREREEFKTWETVVLKNGAFNWREPLYIQKKSDTLNKIYGLITEEEQLAFYYRRLELADKLRIKDKRLFILVILLVFLPIIFVVMMILILIPNILWLINYF